MIRAGQARGDAAAGRRKDVKLELSPGLNLDRSERSTVHIYAYVGKEDKTDNTRSITNCVDRYHPFDSLKTDEYSRNKVVMQLDLLSGESRGYWKYHAPDKWQAKACGKINNQKATMLFDSGAEVSIIDSAFARKVGCRIDDTQR